MDRHFMGERRTPERPVPLVAHVIQGLEAGGVGDALLDLIDHMPRGTYRHTIVCMTDFPDTGLRMRRDDVILHGLFRRGRRDLKAYLRLRRLLGAMRPEIVHTWNPDTLGAQLMAAWSEVACRVHGEHDRDISQATTSGPLARYLARTWAGQHIALTDRQAAYLTGVAGVPPVRVSRVRAGVDTDRFRPAEAGEPPPFPPGFAPDGSVVIGAVLPMRPNKAPGDLARAFIRLRSLIPERFEGLRLAMVGEGPLRESLQALLTEAGVGAQTWLPGFRDDVPGLLRGMDVFVRPSRTEVISAAVLEAMACGLPVVATDVGGNPELVVPGETGSLVPAGDVDGLARVLADYVADPGRRAREGASGRTRVESRFTLEAMVGDYRAVYDRLLGR
jgi:sugar transferase (PEP-CTERM/EpsH1 system associated)